MKEFIIKYQVIIFFILSAVIGYAPWIFMRRPIWLIWGMSVSGALLTFYLDGKSGLLKILKRAVPKKEDIKPLICIPLFFILIEIALSILMTWLYQTSAAPLFIGGIYCHLSMNVINCLMTTKITFSTLAGVAPTNNHYIVIFGIEMTACAVFLIIKTRGQLR